MDDEKIIVTKFAFDQYWVGANICRIQGLMSCEIEALIEYHWQLLVEEAAYETKPSDRHNDT